MTHKVRQYTTCCTKRIDLSKKENRVQNDNIRFMNRLFEETGTAIKNH